MGSETSRKAVWSRSPAIIPSFGKSDMRSFDIRPETPGDYDAVFRVEEAAFGQPDQAHLVNALRASSEPQVSMVAEVSGDVVGHIFFSPVAFESPDPPSACQLSPLAVLPKFQRIGIGGALVEAGLNACLQIGWVAAFLLGDPGYYSKFGFRMAADKSLVHSGTDGEYLQYRELEDDALANVSGEVRFHPMFDAFE